MDNIKIIKVEVLETKELSVTPEVNRNDLFQFIYRTATGVTWNEKEQCFISPIPKEWSHFDWYANIVDSVISEMGVNLIITKSTKWHNVPQNIQDNITNYESVQST